MALKVFEIEVTVTKTVTGTVHVLAESLADIKAVRRDQWEHYSSEDNEDTGVVDVDASESPETAPRDVDYVVRGKKILEATEADRKDAEGERPIIDDRTIPLALPRTVGGKVVVERVTGVPFYPKRAAGVR